MAAQDSTQLPSVLPTHPLVGEQTADTLDNIHDVLAFMQAAFIPPSELSAEQDTRSGLFIVTGCLMDALAFEAERLRPTPEGG